MKKPNRQEITDTLNSLISVRHTIFEHIINLAMTGEMSHLEDAFKRGDTYHFSLAHFEDVEDPTIQKLVRLCTQTEETLFSIMDLNGISGQEIDLE